ncbi:MAG TPA: capsule assembly Wzi family protein, partial [Terriglobales bacterium]
MRLNVGPDPGLLPAGQDPENHLGLPLIRHTAGDQKRLWGSFRGVLDKRNSRLVLPFAGFTGGLIAGDSWISRQVSTDPSQLDTSRTISDVSTYSLVGTAAGAYVLGALTRNDHLRETGLLGGEAALNAAGSAYLLKAITQRPRPEANGNSNFFQGGHSFPSEHSAIAWSIASVLAHEYPGPLTKAFAYGLASAVTVNRVMAKQHFASDVWVGSILGWYIGRQVYRAHHDVELGGAPWGSAARIVSDRVRNPANMASPYVPLDSWVYPALQRLATQNYVQSAYLGMRPWTRMQCAQMVQEAQSDARYQSGESREAAEIIRRLQGEFADEIPRLEGAAPNTGLGLESVYTRVTGISGSPLRDGYHFGQTITNDFGRPYGKGMNAVMGLSGRAVAGPFAFYARGEYQQAGSVDPLSQNALNQIAIADFRLLNLSRAPSGYSIYTGPYDRFQLLEGTVSLAVKNLQFSFGKQSLWLGPGGSGALLFSNNAEPFTMLRVDAVSPYQVPLLSRIFGPVRSEYFIGQLAGHDWIYQPPTLYGPATGRQPFIHGAKTSFKPTQNLEFGFGFAAMFGGPGLPVTWPWFLKTFYSHKADLAQNPGKRFSSFDFTYRIPKLRNWLTAYVDSLVVDEVSVIGS